MARIRNTLRAIICLLFVLLCTAYVALHRLSIFHNRGAGGFQWRMVPVAPGDFAGGLTGTMRRECAALTAVRPRVRSIAVVGNGPISKLQKKQIAASDVVIRFNKLMNRFCGERLDIWVVRYGRHAKMRYHGLNETQHCSTEEALDTLASLWFLDAVGKDREAAMAGAIKTYPQLENKTIAIDKQPLFKKYLEVVDRKGSPSSGWAGMMLALECAPKGAKVHVFGFNWSRRHWKPHKMDAEEAFATKLHKQGKIYIHWPICHGLRTCGGCNVVQGFNSSHFICAPATDGLQTGQQRT